MKHSSFYNDKVPRNLSEYEKKAIGIVVTGNFLEYFDLMLFTHLAFVVTPYFTPKSDPAVAKLLTILAFSSSFVIRPFAAYFWGYIGDHFGRVVVLSYTTLIMGITCFIIPGIPSYEEIGIYSTISSFIFKRDSERMMGSGSITDTAPAQSYPKARSISKRETPRFPRSAVCAFSSQPSATRLSKKGCRPILLI